MRTYFTRLLLTAGLAVGLFECAQAQTARIAHLSHSGSAVTLDEEVDSFGIPPSHFAADSVEILSDSTAREYGRWQGYHHGDEKTNIVRFATPRQGYRTTKQQYLASHKQYQPQVKIIRRDSVTTPQANGPAGLELKKQRTKHKKSVFIPAAPPQHPGVALAVALILTLAGAGWLLGERRPTQPQAA
jgi:hypothetical protein